MRYTYNTTGLGEWTPGDSITSIIRASAKLCVNNPSEIPQKILFPLDINNLIHHHPHYSHQAFLHLNCSHIYQEEEEELNMSEPLERVYSKYCKDLNVRAQLHSIPPVSY